MSSSNDDHRGKSHHTIPKEARDGRTQEADTRGDLEAADISDRCLEEFLGAISTQIFDSLASFTTIITVVVLLPSRALERSQ